MWDIFCKSFVIMVFSDACFAEVLQNVHFCILEYVSEGLYNHLHPVTNKRLPNTSSLSDIAAVVSASAHVHVDIIGSKIHEDNESTDLYFPFLLVSAQRITSLVI